MEHDTNHLIRAGQIRAEPVTHVLVVGPEERAALAALYNLPNISLLRGEFSLQHERSGIIAAKLHMQARITQTCVITLEPFDAKINEHGNLRFVPAQSLPESEGVELDPETLEGPDEIPYTGDLLDLGAALAEQLALALDPYPRKPGAVLPGEFSEAPQNPFAALKGRIKE
jgi:uncharacterized metal-binding protein YceD (DUF177 family)